MLLFAVTESMWNRCWCMTRFVIIYWPGPCYHTNYNFKMKLNNFVQRRWRILPDRGGTRWIRASATTFLYLQPDGREAQYHKHFSSFVLFLEHSLHRQLFGNRIGQAVHGDSSVTTNLCNFYLELFSRWRRVNLRVYDHRHSKFRDDTGYSFRHVLRTECNLI